MSNVIHLVTHRTASTQPGRVAQLDNWLYAGTIKRVYMKLSGGVEGAQAAIALAYRGSGHVAVTTVRDVPGRYLSIRLDHKPKSAAPPPGRAA